MIPVPSGVRVWLATGHTDMRKGFASLSLLVQEVLRRDPLSGQLFSWSQRRPVEGDLARRPRSLPVHEAVGTGPLLVAERARRRGDDLPRPNSVTCTLESIGVIRRRHGVRPRWDDSFALTFLTNMILLSSDIGI
jgi:transposase